MKSSLFVLVVFCCYFTLFGWTSNVFFQDHRLQRSTVEETKNTGCDLFHSSYVTLKYTAIVFYSQRLAFSSLDDIERLFNELRSFIASCCAEQPHLECFFSKDIIIQGRICEDRISKSKNKQALPCCDQDHLQRERCFLNLQNNYTVPLPSLGEDHVSYGEECLSWTVDKLGFIESYLHEFTKRLRKFSLPLTINMFYPFLLIYVKCCERSEKLESCFSAEKKFFPLIMGNKIKVENQMCDVTRQWEQEPGALIFYAKMKPGDSLEKALQFQENIMALAFQCCEPETLTSECFEPWSDVLLAHVCLRMDDTLQKTCCLKSNPEKQTCLTELAIQESKTISNITIEKDQICKLSNDSQLLNWIAYEYPRRNPSKSFITILKFVTILNTETARCCFSNDTDSCGLTNFHTYFDL
ncbi:albumin [Bombina bombina]|uniref:albumin n=1 Tax=Bombina bombina TaxID=8345 RepID=UPI00235A87F8|nr:albumin [Bombina bombina]